MQQKKQIAFWLLPALWNKDDAPAAERRMIMAKYIEREALVEWLKRIPLKDYQMDLGFAE